MELSPSRETRRERLHIAGGRASEGSAGLAGAGAWGRAHPPESDSGRAPPNDKHLSVTQPGEAKAARSSAPSGERSIPAEAPHRGGHGRAEGGERRCLPREHRPGGAAASRSQPRPSGRLAH